MLSMNIDLRKEFNLLREEFGHDVIYRRASKKIKCRCYDTLHKSGDSDCPICEGTGSMVSFEKHNIIDEPFDEGASRSLLKFTDIGKVYQSERVVFMNHDTHPSVGDMIYIVGWKGKYPVTIHKVLEVQYSEPMKGDKGRIEFYHCIGKNRPDLMSDARKTLSKIIGQEVEVRG